MPIPAYLTPYVLGATVVIVIALLSGLNLALRLAAWRDEERRRAVVLIGTFLVGWFFAALIPTALGWYRAAPGRIPTIQYGILIPIIAGVILFRRWRLLQRIVDSVPVEWISGVQLYRVLGLIFLVLYAEGRLPGLFAWPAGLGDVLVGLFAPVMAIAYAFRSRQTAGPLRIWNLVGITDLVVAVGTGAITSPSALQIASLDASNRLVTVFPLALIPVFLVPLSVLLHLASLRKLRQSEIELRDSRLDLTIEPEPARHSLRSSA